MIILCKNGALQYNPTVDSIINHEDYYNKHALRLNNITFTERMNYRDAKELLDKIVEAACNNQKMFKIS